MRGKAALLTNFLLSCPRTKGAVCKHRTLRTRNSAKYWQHHPSFANTGFRLHIIEPMGFAWDDSACAARGWTITSLPPLRVIMLSRVPRSRKSPAPVCPHHESTPAHSAVSYQDGDYLMFGPEHAACQRAFLMPCPLNKKFASDGAGQPQHEPVQCGVSCGVEAWRQLGYPGALLRD